jgi:NAD(P)H-hydrate epimerase
MAGEAAARVGAGLVSLAIDGQYRGAITAARPELMCHGIEGPADLQPLLERATLLALGPGLGRDAWARALWEACVGVDLPLVLDADALSLLAEQPRRREDWVLTPHPGEAARLLGTSAAAVQADRFAAVEAIQRRYGGVCVLKGAGSLVADGEHPIAVCRFGNPGMASGGMGDVLTGVIAGLHAQGLSAWEASGVGTAVHGRAGDAAAADGQRGLLATDLLVHLRRLVNPVANR